MLLLFIPFLYWIAINQHQLSTKTKRNSQEREREDRKEKKPSQICVLFKTKTVSALSTEGNCISNLKNVKAYPSNFQFYFQQKHFLSCTVEQQ